MLRLAIAGVLLLCSASTSQQPARLVVSTHASQLQSLQAAPVNLSAQVNSDRATARLRGRVVAADSGLPVKGAQMELIPVPFRSEWRQGTITDGQGRFEFAAVHAGRYTLSAAKPGFVRLTYPQRVGNEPSTTIDVSDGKSIEALDFSVPRGGVIVVTIVDPAGDAVAQVGIRATRSRPQTGMAESGGPDIAYGTTNDLGQARVFGLPPGDYYLSARSNAIRPPSSNEPAVTYFPGTLVAAEARRVSVTAAQEVLVSMPLLDGRRVTISGSVHLSNGSPVFPTVPFGGRGGRAGAPPTGYSVYLQTQRDGPAGDTAPPSTAIPVQPDGTFTLGGVAPGRYDILVNQRYDTAPFDAEYARVPLTVGVDDISGISVVTKRGATLRGRVVFDTGQPPPNLQPRAFAITAYSADSVMPAGPGRTTMFEECRGFDDARGGRIENDISRGPLGPSQREPLKASQPVGSVNLAEMTVECAERTVAGFACDLHHQAIGEAHRWSLAKLSDGCSHNL
jgi:hypothetical protein